jgi:phage baseplate assembly protein W
MAVDPNDFLGTGWSFPPAFDRYDASAAMSSDVDNIRQCLWVLLSTRLGERLMLATYGTGIWSKVFDGLTNALAKSLESEVANAILNWEPRIDVESIAVGNSDPTDGTLSIVIDFVVRRTNTRGNLVYPFYIQEGTLPPAPI